MTIKQNLPTLTVGIPAHNEAGNIIQLLDALQKQHSKTYTLIEIIVLCDGSSDGTDKLVKEYAKTHPIVRVIDGKENKGKTYRLNQLYEQHKGEFLISADGDVSPADKDVFDKLISEFKDKDVVLVAANSIPNKGQTLVEKISSFNSEIWYEAGKVIKNGHNSFALSGQMFAIRGSYAKKFRYPADVFTDEKYLYLSVIKANLKFRFVKKAVIGFRSPATLEDYFFQSRRFLYEFEDYAKYFDKELLKETIMPRSRVIYSVASKFLRDPLTTISVLAISTIFRLIPVKRNKVVINQAWRDVPSTKTLNEKVKK